jgi:Na+-translocating ferredoxin:NAD+ oxidoreductase subunit B
MNAAVSVERIDALLPQTQCTRCGYPTCRAYAEAIAADVADIDRCPPGGAQGIEALAALLGRTSKPLDPACGFEAPPIVALIDEDVCIGCTKCIQACPVDAIVGAAKRMHTIIAAECTGCELCLPPCPVDCIVLIPIAAAPLGRAQVLQRAAAARARFDARNARHPPSGVGAADAAMPSAASTEQSIAAEAAPAKAADRPIGRAAVLEAIARGKARRAGSKEPTGR